MPEGKYCFRRPLQTEEDILHLLSDTRGTNYYKEMEELEVDTADLKKRLDATCKSRTRTWLEICAAAACAPIAASCTA
jgi:hypothetical protein